MSNVIKNSDIVKGSALQVTLGNGGTILAFATSHALSITVNTTEVSTKDHGDYPGIIKQNTTWEVTCENLFCGRNWDELQAMLNGDTPVNVSFVPLSNTAAEISKGIVQPEGSETVQPTEWTAGTAIAKGQAYITSLNVNSASGDNATISATFTGAGPLTFATYNKGAE